MSVVCQKVHVLLPEVCDGSMFGWRKGKHRLITTSPQQKVFSARIGTCRKKDAIDN